LIFSSIILGYIKQNYNQHEDTVIGALWAMGMSIGIIFIHMTPGYGVDLMTYLFGNILMVSDSDLINLIILDGVIFVIVFLFYRQFIAICFDEEYSKLRGIPVTLIYILLLSIISLTIVVLMQIVGLILLIALLTLPAAISAIYLKNPLKIIVTASFLGLLFTVSGLFISYQTNSPAAAMIIVITGLFYFISLAAKVFLKK